MKPPLALYMVLDRSGSMTGLKVQLAKEAAIAAAEVLKPQDWVGVVAFDSFPHRVLDLTRARERQTIIDEIARIEDVLDDARQAVVAQLQRQLGDGWLVGRGTASTCDQKQPPVLPAPSEA